MATSVLSLLLFFIFKEDKTEEQRLQWDGRWQARPMSMGVLSPFLCCLLCLPIICSGYRQPASLKLFNPCHTSPPFFAPEGRILPLDSTEIHPLRRQTDETNAASKTVSVFRSTSQLSILTSPNSMLLAGLSPAGSRRRITISASD